MHKIASAVSVLFFLGCSAPPTSIHGTRDRGAGGGGASSTSASPSNGSGNSGGAPVFTGDDAGAPAPPPPPTCTDATRLVYVVSEEKQLYSFVPSTMTFTPIGVLACPSASQPFSMAVDRAGTAWVLYQDGGLFKVSTKDASCAPTTYAARQGAFYLFGMGFASDANGSDRETLYVSDITGGGLGRVDTGALAISGVGPYDGALANKSSELTGTGEGRLYGFFTTSPAQVAEIDKTTGRIVSATPMTGVDVGTAWAFSFWGGDFWLYTADPTMLAKDGIGSTVTRYRPSDGSITVMKKGIGFRIVGAGVSTCAPVVPPPPPPPPPPPK